MSKSIPKRGEIYRVSLDTTVGSETKKTWPALILSNDIANKLSPRVIVAPITSSIDRLYPFEAKIKMPRRMAKAMLDQIRTVDKRRLTDKICLASSEEMHDVERALKLTLAIHQIQIKNLKCLSAFSPSLRHSSIFGIFSGHEHYT